MPTCPSCADANPRHVGALPEVGVFAGSDAAGALPSSNLYHCQDCGLRFRHPVLSEDEYDALYDKAVAECWSDEPGRMDWELIQGYLARAVCADARVLDFGCHTGGLLRRLGPRYAKTGVEVNPRAAQIARQESDAEVFPSLGALPRDAKFDLVIAADVIEHFPDPGQVFASLLAVVEPGGVLIVTTGDAEALLWRVAGARWWYCFYPEHLAFISERWTRDWLTRTGSKAQLVDATTFRHRRHSVLRFAVQCGLLLAYLAAPRTYLALSRRLRRMLGRDATAYPPGDGVTRDHVFLALRRTP